MSHNCKTLCKVLRENEDEYISKCGRLFLRKPIEITVQIMGTQGRTMKAPAIGVCVMYV